MAPRKISAAVLKRIERKRFYRRIRSRLIRIAKRGGKLDQQVRSRYKVRRVDPFVQVRSEAKRGRLQKVSIEIPKVLCYYKNPDETSRFLTALRNTLIRHYNMGKPYVYDFSHDKTQYLGLAESFLFDDIVGSHKDRWLNERRVEIGFSGKISKASKEVNNFLLSFGWLKLLEVV